AAGVSHPASAPISIQVNQLIPPDLTVTNIVQAQGRNFATTPWLSGEPLDFNVTVTNLGSGPSDGGEQLLLTIDGANATTSTLRIPQPLNPNQSTTILVHAVNPDNRSTNPSAQLTGEITPGPSGDTNPNNNFLTVPVSTSDWIISVNGLGVDDTGPVRLVVG